MCVFCVLVAAFTMQSQTWGNVQIECLSLFPDLIAEEVARSHERLETGDKEIFFFILLTL